MVNVATLTQAVAVTGRVTMVCADPTVRASAADFRRDAAQAVRSASKLVYEVNGAWQRTKPLPMTAARIISV